MALKYRGRSKKTERWTGPKSKGGSLAVGNYLQGSSAPPPPSLPRGGGRGGGTKDRDCVLMFVFGR